LAQAALAVLGAGLAVTALIQYLELLLLMAGAGAANREIPALTVAAAVEPEAQVRAEGVAQPIKAPTAQTGIPTLQLTGLALVAVALRLLAVCLMAVQG